MPAPVTLAETTTLPPRDLYRDGGFVVGDGSIPFVGTVRFAATEFLDSTAMIVALSIPPRTLSFVRAGDRYAAFYAVRVDVQTAGTITRSERLVGEVRVASFAETNRSDDGVIFQRAVRVPPGAYTLRITASDSLGTGIGAGTTTVNVPAMRDGASSSLMPVLIAEPRRTRAAPLSVVVNPTATIRYGRDSVLRLYLEEYGPDAPDSIVVAVEDDSSARTLYSRALTIPKGAAVRSVQASIPVTGLKLGRNTVTATFSSGAVERTEAVVSLGVDLPVSDTDQLADALRYFASESEVQGLRTATATNRPAQWSALLRKTDPNLSTPENEALFEYARRLRLANALYRNEDQPGWKTARGSVIAALGEPDATSEPKMDPVTHAQTMTWEYKRHRLTLVLVDPTGSGVWKLTPASDSDFRTLVAFSGPCVGCR